MFTDRCCRRLSRLLAGVAGALALALAAPSAHAQIGACCLPTGGCITNAASTQCQSLGGQFLNGGACTQCFGPVPCCIGGICQFIPLSQCAAHGGQQVPGAACTPTSCGQGGACCDPAGGCFQSTQTQCPASNVFVPNGVCSAEPCSPKGACCIPGACIAATKNECDAIAGSTFLGGVGCSPFPCGQVRLCCSAAGACTTVTAATQCNGTLLGGNSCTPNPCPSPQGACCVPTAPGGCVSTTQANCPAGHQFSPGLTCAQANCPGSTGACCRAGGCVQVQAGQCPAGTAFSPGVPCGPDACPPTGACCTAAAGCQITFLFNCAGDWTAGATCDPNPCTGVTGSCCVGTACTQTFYTQCNGQWFAGITCASTPCRPGACCNTLNGKCGVVPRVRCDRPGLVFIGYGVPCTPELCRPLTGSCCLPGTPVCVLSTKSQCTGDWQANRPCAPVNPCCRPDYNGVSGVDLLDIFTFLADWFNGCPNLP